MLSLSGQKQIVIRRRSFTLFVAARVRRTDNKYVASCHSPRSTPSPIQSLASDYDDNLAKAVSGQTRFFATTSSIDNNRKLVSLKAIFCVEGKHRKEFNFGQLTDQARRREWTR